MDRFSELPPKHRKPSVDELAAYKEQEVEEMIDRLERKELAERAQQRRSPTGYVVGD